MAYQIAKAIAYLHDQKIMHRDLKLGNILLNNKFTIVIEKNYSFIHIFF